MNTVQASYATAVFLACAVPLPVAVAQSCSGGPDGGAVVSGNQCSVSTSAATEVDPALWTRISSYTNRAAMLAPPNDSAVPAPPPLLRVDPQSTGAPTPSGASQIDPVTRATH